MIIVYLTGLLLILLFVGTILIEALIDLDRNNLHI